MVRDVCQLLTGIAALALVNISTVSATAADLGAYEVVQKTTDRVMALVDEAPDYVDADPDRYFDALQVVLDDVVDFAGFSRSVMGDYANKKRYKSLSPEGKKQLRAQVERFTGVMRQGLVRTYGKGLLAFGGSRVEVQRPDGAAEAGKATIRQLIYSDAIEPYVIEYQMRRGKKGHWRLRNLIVETVNLGVIYRNQFQAAAKDSGGDLDTVIDNWTAPADAGEV